MHREGSTEPPPWVTRDQNLDATQQGMYKNGVLEFKRTTQKSGSINLYEVPDCDMTLLINHAPDFACMLLNPEWRFVVTCTSAWGIARGLGTREDSICFSFAFQQFSNYICKYKLRVQRLM